MNFLSNEVLTVEEYTLEVLGFKNDVLKKYPVVEKGYLFHFYLGDNSFMNSSEVGFQFNLNYSWKFFIPGTLQQLEKRIETLKEKFIKHYNNLVPELDQFDYLFLFVVKNDDIYELCISSDSFSFDTINDIFNEKN